MKADLNFGTGITFIVLLAIVAIAVTSGCTDTVKDLRGPVTSSGSDQTGQPEERAAALAKTATAPLSLVATQPASIPVSSTGVIVIDPVTDKKAGDTFTLAGTTSLPAGTEIFWQILPDTGSPPTGLDQDSTMSVGGNYLVTPGEGTSNRIAIPVDLGRMVPGNYTVIAGKAKDQGPGTPDWKIGTDFTYTYFCLK